MHKCADLQIFDSNYLVCFLATDAAVPIQVSAGDNKVITLPENKVSLYASTWPKAPKGMCIKHIEHYVFNCF